MGSGTARIWAGTLGQCPPPRGRAGQVRGTGVRSCGGNFHSGVGGDGLLSLSPTIQTSEKQKIIRLTFKKRKKLGSLKDKDVAMMTSNLL